MTYYDRLKRKRLCDILVDEAVASKEAVITALHEHHQSDRLLSQILLQGQELREYDLARIVVEQYQLPFLDLAACSYHRDLIAKFPPRFLHHARLMPLDAFGEVVCFACQEFPSDAIFTELGKYGTSKLFLFAALAAEIRQALHDHVPLEDERLAADTAIAAELGAPVAAARMEDDSAWKDLFDAADNAVVSDLHKDDAE